MLKQEAKVYESMQSMYPPLRLSGHRGAEPEITIQAIPRLAGKHTQYQQQSTTSTQPLHAQPKGRFGQAICRDLGGVDSALSSQKLLVQALQSFCTYLADAMQKGAKKEIRIRTT